MFKELLLEDIERGIKGENKGIPTGFPVIDSNTNGLQKSMYHLVGGNSGTGKTSYVDEAYVLNPYAWWLANRDKTDIKIEWEYNSMERNTKYKLAKWTCLKLFKDYKIIMDVPTMLGWSGKKYDITDDIKEKVLKSGTYFDEMFNSGIIRIHDGGENPTGIYNRLNKLASERGQILQVNEFTRRYVPNDPNLHIIVINDHIGKLSGERNFTDKELIDKHSQYMGIVRDRYGFIIVDISQFNRAIGNLERFKNKDVSPEPDDFKSSGDMYENADLVFALFNPYKIKVNDFLGYDIPKFIAKNGENRFRSISILKNSYGADDIIVGLNFLGENGSFRELPTADAFKNNPGYYKKAVEFT